MNRIRSISFLETKEIFAVSSNTRRLNRSHGRALCSALVLICIFASFGLSGCGSDSKAFSSPSSNSSSVVITPSTVDFGDVKVGTSASTNVSVTNSGDSSLQISAITSSNGAFTVRSNSLPATLSAGQSLTVKIQYDPTTATDSTGSLSLTSISTSTTAAKSSSTIKLH